MPKAPPRLKPPAYVPAPRQVYAHVHGGFEVGCPACGYLSVIGPVRLRRMGHRLQDARSSGARVGYDRDTGILRCGGCGRAYYVGILLWPIGGRARLAEDHVPGVQELAQLRGVGAGGSARKGKSGRAMVNGIGETEEGEE